eukprot:4006622-Amphidinium_carterae.1
MNAAGKGHPQGKSGAGTDDLFFSPGACRPGKGLTPPCPNTEHTIASKTAETVKAIPRHEADLYIYLRLTYTST